MASSRLDSIAGIGVDQMGSCADAAADDELLRLENLDTNLPLPNGVVDATANAVNLDSCNSYLPFFGQDQLRKKIATISNSKSGLDRDWKRSIIICAGGLNGILNTLLATIDTGDEVVVQDPIYIGLLNRIRLAGGVPVFLDRFPGRFSLDPMRAVDCVTSRTKAFLIMSPSMPAGNVLSRDDWAALCKACVEADAWMIYDAAMESILFDDRQYVHPANFPGMAERTITVGSFSKEYRMIGWRIGWIDAPEKIVDEIGLVNISNVVCNVGFSQPGCLTALDESAEERRLIVEELERRRDILLHELADYGVISADGGWSLLLDTSAYADTATLASAALMKRGKIAATPITGWGSDERDRYLRLVFSNESTDRLRDIGDRFRKTFS